MKLSLGDSVEWRVLRIMVCAYALPLSKIYTLKAFKKVFLDLIHCHYVVYEKAGILHRDLSVSNLMFRLSTRGPFGVLNDWDLSEDVAERKQDGSQKHPAARHRTGTAPFMALELLYEKLPCHLYCHDLKSFVWILIWCALHFDLQGCEKPLLPVVKSWTRGDWKDIQGHKMNLLTGQREGLRKLYAKINPAFAEIVKSWIIPLVNMPSKAYAAMHACDTSNQSTLPKPAPVVAQEKDFSEMYGDAEVIDDMDGKEDADLLTDNAAIGNQDVQEQNGPWDEETLRGLMTFAKFMAAIGESADIPDL
ncbi:hypothetical protein EWM64_g7376 [Hericium alpestre]|uniref:Protein kinase domain-containing protein n=1 Tax=Hericium alpestre TaxID=135208 RepID=A0A4Y9ZPX0_9AGAM|nr:hypothetical protein EWM64_g7376 [Hericium alpestre]